MKIILADSAGFCFGVKRATNLAFDAAEQFEHICSLGPIIHSPQVVKKLEEKGIKVIRKVEDIDHGAVIIRSHGITAEELDIIHDRELKIVDATCPFVKKAQDYATMLCNEGYSVVLVGEKDHPEVQGIISYTRGGEVFVVADCKEAQRLPNRPKLGIVAQTTQSFKNLQQIADICLGKSKEVRIFNTICDATSVRQNEARKIACEADLMLVVGGFNSANTTRLAQICQEIQPRTFHVETVEQIQDGWFEGVECVGITAGASTPRWIIDQVVERVSDMSK
ncbi:4-hydroxy-3-methylbut-2-en-1-yl diphosphate reductase [Syntrophotalea carbinolica DSM 2380]|uniref:4-hydroxy-3-methylbut-2-enyl diphosphate reductase n=1 Tax=Syntrophotalea carbinolica (strain DSM 2380 / NBRC 103641 / GraBd1) TaxID=338963 RepID=ISPH_SYNC1|nr:4-hydroxy-3-methylbut-2-enyl diphosphate reductase [Syntrophotalea carbinolica]Q3A3D3.1 RecName: Full=4-hydroxy-3-methylbut-2-enyl diphosphate reductase; Short=HMBPP reductase [Syntrophotalea carbinolica DSM 2380]ABA89124.1 4-hydroxy-3-methylbut-2-en-1-yl diphosphate reductase [Syntrophotalea carbinolica DSM 2380]